MPLRVTHFSCYVESSHKPNRLDIANSKFIDTYALLASKYYTSSYHYRN